jgi:hypothetical protein
MNFKTELYRDGENELVVTVEAEVYYDEGAPGSVSYPSGLYVEIESVKDKWGKEVTISDEEDEELQSEAATIFRARMAR